MPGTDAKGKYMRATLEIIGIVLLVNGIGGLVRDDFGLLTHVADGDALTVLRIAAVVVGAALAGGSWLSRSAAKSRDSRST
ncbi:hypothetical protein [Phytoactinopolyspora mesophila]|uniref:DUF378 domain-containing protein n=1 Tax=Phytoactinopolyspora mesophila TaxID=2650750 RepID=A0A7K3M8C1_9ACTN|nr:hypothetical protein [Phytoactinopolyspora mesophila]NDL59420.1 hypothetical protein [Phytoactinopolyspora mesophila]